MAWVKTFSEKEAAGGLADVYGELMKSPLGGGRVPNIMKCMGLRPEALSAVWRLNMSITFGASTLGRRREEMIATAVSALNHCHY
jgi:alkylhydroperoxidase family enzyme